MTDPNVDPHAQLSDLAGALRRAGIEASLGQLVALATAVQDLPPLGPADLESVARACLVTRASDLATFDAVFRGWLVGVVDMDGGHERDAERMAHLVDRPGVPPASGAEDVDGSRPDRVGRVASRTDWLRHRRFDETTDEELRQLQRLMRELDLTLPQRRTRRRQPTRSGRDLDLARSLRRALRTDAELMDWARRRRRRRPRPLVLLLDISGSMAGFSQALLQFAFSARNHAMAVEVFTFGTELTRLTRTLDERDLDRALAAVGARVRDWDGGTRIGASLDALNRRWAATDLLRGAVVVICSDGLERGDPEQLASAMARLHRTAHAVVWVNPLKADPEYEPLARGMQAALPHVDRFLAGHDLASLEELADVVGALG